MRRPARKPIRARSALDSVPAPSRVSSLVRTTLCAGRLAVQL